MNDEPLISVVIPTYNRARMVRECVASILETGYSQLEVLVVDDCSPDDTKDELSRFFAEDARVHYLKNERNSLSAHSRNHGASHAKGEYIYFTDDDNIVDPQLFTELLKTFDRHPKAGFVAPITCNVSGKKRLVWTIGSYFNPWTSQCSDVRPMPSCVEDIPSDVDDYPTRYSPNAFMVTRAAFDAVGGFDEVMRMQYDESDFGYRVCEAGFEAYISARAHTDHHGFLDPGTTPILRTLGIGRPNRAFAFGKNRVIFARRHFSFLQALSVAFVFAPLSAVYYGWLSVRHLRFDIAFSYLAGTLAGMFRLYRSFDFTCRVGDKREG